MTSPNTPGGREDGVPSQPCAEGSLPVLTSDAEPSASDSISMHAFIDNGPQLWRLILKTLPPGAIIAGGAVRDYLLDVAPKDIDVFFPVENWSSEALAGFSKLGGDRDDEYAAMPTIAIVVRGHRYGHPVDVVGVHMDDATPLAIVNSFDFGVSRCWFDGERIHDTAEAKTDRETKTVTCLLTDRAERSAQRFRRFNERLGGGWQYVTGNTEPASAEGTDAAQVERAWSRDEPSNNQGR